MRELFPVTKNLIYFNHAAVGPLSVRAAEAVERHAADQREFGALHWRDWYATQDAARASAARLIGANEAEIAILKNTSEGLAFVAEGYRWREGENVVTTAFEFPSNLSPWRHLARRGVETRVAATPSLEHIEALVDAKTRLVSVSAVAFHNGAVADLDAIGDFCAQRGILFCVDAIQAAGVLPIDVRRSKISFLAADGHKWICALEGAAIFFVAEEHLDKLEVLELGWTNVQRKTSSFLDATDDLVAGARRFEAGSLNTAGTAALRAAIDLLLEIGIDEISRRTVAIANLLGDRLESIGCKVARPIASGIVGATPPVVDGRELMRLHGALEKEGIICAPREGMLRFSPHFYNDESEVERVGEVMRREMRNQQ